MEEKRAWYQTYAQALDIAVFFPSVNDLFVEDDLLAKTQSLCEITPALNLDLYLKPSLFNH